MCMHEYLCEALPKHVLMLREINKFFKCLPSNVTQRNYEKLGIMKQTKLNL